MRLGVLTLLAELTGRSITGRLDHAFHVMPLATPDAAGYPFALAAIRVLAAFALAGLLWRLLRAHLTAAAGEHLVSALGRQHAAAPRLHVRLSARLWLFSFATTALWFLVEADAAQLARGRWSLLAPLLHTYALPVFAVLSVVVAVAWGLVRDWVAEVELYAATTLARAYRGLDLAARTGAPRQRSRDSRTPRQLFGGAIASRGPPLAA